MAGRIKREDIESLRQRVDIAEVVTSYTELKRAGGRMKGLCPFHNEKTPSFTVDPGQGVYHCFGCQAGGDVFKFIMELEGFDFTEAVESLAKRYGITLTYENLTAGQERALGERTRLQTLNQQALEFFQACLYGDEGTVARDYLKARGFGREEADAFKLGYAPNDWERLARSMLTSGVAANDLVRVGLAKRNDRGGLRDVFRGRLIFPILDAAGEVVGFGGRVLPELDYGDFDPPKYLNTPETPLYSKSKVLYGLPQARATMSRNGEVLVCEGYTDVMALHQAGFANAVATCGTAMGTEHVRLLTRYAPRLVLAFDGDAAGAGAAERAWQVARGFEVDVRVLILPEGKDPADVVDAEGGVEQMQGLVEAAEPVVPFTIRMAIQRHDVQTEEGRAAALKEAVELLGKVDDPDLRRIYARREVADQLGISIEFVERTAERAGVTLDKHRGVASRPSNTSGARQGQGSAGPATPRTVSRAKLERAVLRAALQRPDVLPDAWYEASDEDFTHPRAQSVHRAIAEAGGPGVPLSAVLEVAEDDTLRGLIREVALEEDELATNPQHVAVLVNRLLLPRVEGELNARKAELERMNPQTDPDAYTDRFRAVVALEARRRDLRSDGV